MSHKEIVGLSCNIYDDLQRLRLTSPAVGAPQHSQCTAPSLHATAQNPTPEAAQIVRPSTAGLHCWVWNKISVAGA